MQPTLRQSCPTSSNAKTGRRKTTLYSLQSSLLSARFPLHQWIFGQTEPLPNELRELFTLPRAHGVLGIPDLKPEAPQQYAASKLITVPHVGTIRTQALSCQWVSKLWKTWNDNSSRSRRGQRIWEERPLMHLSHRTCQGQQWRPQTRV